MSMVAPPCRKTVRRMNKAGAALTGTLWLVTELAENWAIFEGNQTSCPK